MKNIGVLPNGLKLYEDKNLTVRDGSALKYVDRSIKERLCGKLYGRWKPLNKKRLVSVPNYIPDGSFYLTDDKLICHPQTAQELRRYLQKGYDENSCRY